MAGKKESASKTDGLYLLFWGLLPFIYITSLVDYTLIPRQLFSALFLLITMGASWKFLFSSGRLNRSVLSYAGFIIVTAIASFGALNTVESIATLVRYGVAFSFLAVTISLLQQGKLSYTGLLKGVILFAGITSVMTLIEIFEAMGSGDFFEDIYTVKATFSHKNILSATLMLSMPFCIAGAVLLKKIWKNISFLVVFLMLVEIFVLRTRGVWLSTFVAVFVVSCLFFFFRKKQVPGVKYPGKYIGAGILTALILMIGLLSVDNVSQSILNPANVDRRVEFWESSMKMIGEHPVMGVGAGNWKIHFPKYGLNGLDWSVRQGITHIQRPHNDYLWVWAEGGPLALLFYLGIFIAALWRVVVNLRSAKSKEAFVLNISMTFGIVAFMVFSLADFPLERMETNVLMLSAVALVYADPRDKEIRIPSHFLKFLFLIVLGFAVIVLYYRWQGEKAASGIIQANAQRNAPFLIKYTDEAENAFYNMDNFANPVRYYSSLGKMVQRDQQAALVDAQIAYDLHPNNIVVLNQMGNVLKHLGRIDESLNYYTKAIEISPTFELSLLSIAEIKVRQQEYLDAMEALIYIDPESQNGKFLQLINVTLPHIVNYEGDNPPKLPVIVREMKERSRGADPSTYLSAYRQYRRDAMQRAIDSK